MRNTIKGLLITAVLVTAGTACTPVQSDEPVKAKPAPASTAPKSAAPKPESTNVRVTRDDLALRVKVREKQCFGSAGCNVTVQLVPAWSTTKPEFSDDYDVTYKITGDESGPVIGTFTVYPNGKYDVPEEEWISTPSNNTAIKASVVRVEKTLG